MTMAAIWTMMRKFVAVTCVVLFSFFLRVNFEMFIRTYRKATSSNVSKGVTVLLLATSRRRLKSELAVVDVCLWFVFPSRFSFLRNNNGLSWKVTNIFNSEMKRAGFVLNTNICPHFAMARVDLFNVIKVRKLRTFGEVMDTVGIDKNAIGCEICKPAIGSILSSLYVLFTHFPSHRIVNVFLGIFF